MKNTKYALVVLAAVLSAVACTKEIENEQPGLGTQPEKGNMIINAVAGSLGNPDDTKAHGNFGYEIVWDENDNIAVTDGNNKGTFEIIEGVGETLGKFAQNDGPELSGDVTAYYPASILQADGNLFWPAEQKYSKNELTGLPMTGSATVAEEGGTNFNFKNLGGVLQLVLTSEVGELPMKKIIVSDTNAGLSGRFTMSDGAASGFTAGTSVEVDCIGLTLGTSAQTVNISLPAGNYTDFHLTFVTMDGMSRTMTSTSLKLKRNVVTKVTLALNNFERVCPDYLHFTAVGGAVSVEMTGGSENAVFQYSSDPQSNEWTDVSIEAGQFKVIKELSEGETVYLRGKSFDTTMHGRRFYFGNAGKVKAGGNIMSLLDPAVQSLEVGDSAFEQLFITCSALLTAPSLPAMTLGEYCYKNMFSNCTSLIEAPELPAKVLSKYCYNEMFSGCASLKEAPVIRALALASNCCAFMFSSCTSLEKPATIEALEMADFCFDHMYFQCTSLKEAPELPALTLASNCYEGMFGSCLSLKKAPELPATKLAYACYYNMFFECTSLEEAPFLHATELAQNCYANMFMYCSALKSITVMFTKFKLPEYPYFTTRWLSGVTTPGVFYCPGELEIDITGIDTVPEGWEIRRTTLPSSPKIGDKIYGDGVEGVYVGMSGGKKLVVATKNIGAEGIHDKGTAFTRDELENLELPYGWELPTAADMGVLAGLEFTNDSTYDGAYSSQCGIFIPYTQDVSEGTKREGRLWVDGSGYCAFYWFRSDNFHGLTTEKTKSLNYYVRPVRKF